MAERTVQAYQELIQRVREEAMLASIEALLEWDEEVQMPAGAVEGRSEQLAMIAGSAPRARHRSQAGRAAGARWRARRCWPIPSLPHAVNVRELRRDYDRFVQLPRTLVQDLARTTSVAQHAWAAARAAADFGRFHPHLERIVALKRAEASCLGYAREPYDALIEDYEPGITSAIVGRLFDALRRELVPLAARIAGASSRPDAAMLRRPVPLEGQRRFSEHVAAAAGFDFHRGRLDLGVHPCCTSLGPGDCRIGLRFDLRDFVGGVLTVLHEVGHGLYEQGLDPRHLRHCRWARPRRWGWTRPRRGCGRTGWGGAVGSGSISCRPRANDSRRLWATWSWTSSTSRVNRVTPSLIRVNADEVTYNVHVMIRFELERALMSGDLCRRGPAGRLERRVYAATSVSRPRTTPKVVCRTDTGRRGSSDTSRPIRLGDVFGAQLFARARRELGDLEESFARGEFRELVRWLRDRIYCQGSRYPSARLIEVVAGAPPDHRPLVEELRARYGALYGL